MFICGKGNVNPVSCSRKGFNFKNLNRSGTHSVKWEQVGSIFGARDVLPMWVADGDLPGPPEIGEALRNRARHEIFGYTLIPETFFPTLRHWFDVRFAWEVREEWYIHAPGVISALNVALLAFCQPGDRIVIQPPVYYRFFDTIRAGGYELAFNPLRLTDGNYEIDFWDLEQQFQKGAKMFILCSPHNPVGRVWKAEEIKRIVLLAEEYGVLLFSDEIFCDVVLPGYLHTPLLKLCNENARVILCNAPSKTFNMAGLQMSNVWIPNSEIRDQFVAMRNRCGNPRPNLLGLVAAEAAYKNGAAWLDGFLDLIVENFHLVQKSLGQHKVHMVDAQATYLAWLDFRGLGLNDKDLFRLLTKRAKLGLSSGSEFGCGGEGFMRMNLSCDQDTVLNAMTRLQQAI
jgi:cysteine-S-conjugate beta-lyase